MNNIIIPVASEDMLEFAENAIKRKTEKIIIGITKSLESLLKKPRKKENVVIKVFCDGSKKEEMINSLKTQLDQGAVLICRKSLTGKEIDEMLSCPADIVTLKIKRNKFKRFFFNIWQTLMSMLFGFTFYEGDISAIAFNESQYNVISNVENLSYISRINKWKGVTYKEVESSSPPVTKEYSKVKANLVLSAWILLFLMVIASVCVYFNYIRATFLTGLLFTCALLLCQIFLVIEIASFVMCVKVGQRVFKKAKLYNKEEK